MPVSASMSSFSVSPISCCIPQSVWCSEDDFASPQQSLRQDQRTNHVVGDDPTGVANDVCVAVGETEHLEDVHPAVHARDDGQLSARLQGEVVVGEGLDVPGVVGKQFVGARFEQASLFADTTGP